MKTIFTHFFQVIYFCFLGFHSILAGGSICPLWRHPLPCFYLAGRVKEMFESCAPWEQKARGFTLEAHSPTSSTAGSRPVSQSMTQRCHQKGGRSTSPRSGKLESMPPLVSPGLPGPESEDGKVGGDGRHRPTRGRQHLLLQNHKQGWQGVGAG